MKTPHRTRFLSLSLLRRLLCLSLILGLWGPSHDVARAGAAPSPFPIEMVTVSAPADIPVDCRPIFRHIGRVKAKIRQAKRIRNGAQRRRVLNRLTAQLTQLRREYRRCLAAPPIVVANEPDPLNSGDVPGIGAVPYDFQIGKYEVTLKQYTAFLNAVAKTDPAVDGLYHPSMGTDDNIKGIMQDGAPGSHTYTVIGSGKRPVTYVSWFDCARFCNWLHNGSPTGAQDATTTERGAYTLDGAIMGVGFTRNPGAKYWIPSEDEWYKAAYHRPNSLGGPADHYYLYPTESDTLPGNIVGPVANHANHRTPDGKYSVTQNSSYSRTQNYLTDGGSYPGSPSFYGTFDQGGNVWEWNDAVINGSYRGLRGGSWDNFTEDFLRSSFRSFSNFDPDVEYAFFGFRIASP